MPESEMGVDSDLLGPPDARSAAFRAGKDILFGSVSRFSIHSAPHLRKTSVLPDCRHCIENIRASIRPMQSPFTNPSPRSDGEVQRANRLPDQNLEV